MPAVSVADITVLPRIKETPHARARTVKSITTAPQGFEGEGFPVRRAFAGVDLAELDPFIHLDQMGEVEYAPGEPKGTPWHPSIVHNVNRTLLISKNVSVYRQGC